jgi:hypothetical protein
MQRCDAVTKQNELEGKLKISDNTSGSYVVLCQIYLCPPVDCLMHWVQQFVYSLSIYFVSLVSLFSYYFNAQSIETGFFCHDIVYIYKKLMLSI